GGRASPGRHDLRTVTPVSWDDTTLARLWFSPQVPGGSPLARNTGPVAAASVGHRDVAEPAVSVAAAGEDTGSDDAVDGPRRRRLSRGQRRGRRASGRPRVACCRAARVAAASAGPARGPRGGARRGHRRAGARV